MLMFWQYEMRHWLVRNKIWMFVLAFIVFGITLVAMTAEFVDIGGHSAVVQRNAPFVMQNVYSDIVYLIVFLCSIITTSIANRDYTTRMNYLVFVAPIHRRDYFFGRLLGSISICTVLLLFVHGAMTLSPFMPWVSPDSYGNFNGYVHVHMWLTIGVPLIFVMQSLLYAIEIHFPGRHVSAYVLFFFILLDLIATRVHEYGSQTETIGALLTPLSNIARSHEGSSFSSDMMNTMVVSLSGTWLYQLLLWCTIAGIVLMVAYFRFSFTVRQKTARTIVKLTDGTTSSTGRTTMPAYTLTPWTIRSLLYMTMFYTKILFKGKGIFSMFLALSINLLGVFVFSENIYGVKNYPFTFLVIDDVVNAVSFLLIGFVLYFGVNMIWIDREYRIHGIIDALPTPNGLRMVAQVISLYVVVIGMYALMIAMGVVWQLLAGVHVMWSLYVQELLLFAPLNAFYWIVLATVIAHMIRNKSVALSVAFFSLIGNIFLPVILRQDHHLLQYASVPAYTISEMSGYGPFLQAVLWHHAYWFAWSLVLLVIASWWIVRGETYHWRERWKTVRMRMATSRTLFSTFLLISLCIGGWIVYNTVFLNEYQTAAQIEQLQKKYEMNYKKYEKVDQPKWTSVHYEVDLYPSDHRVAIRIDATMQNKTNRAIEEIHFTMPSFVVGDNERMRAYAINIKDATLVRDDVERGFRTYKLQRPLPPTEEMDVQILGDIRMRGFENEQPFPELNKNGTFLNSANVFPIIGYSRHREIIDRERRETLELPKRQSFASLDANNQRARSRMAYISDADWISTSTKISTDPGQIAIAPGELVRSWNEKGRPHFMYETKEKALHFHAFFSAQYAVTREIWRGITLEVYHDPLHAVNVPRMLSAMRHSLAYYTQNFGPYPQSYARIIEFPRYGKFAQAFLGTMPYSEEIGFMLDMRDLKPDQSDLITFVVAHEMAHQYWAHQLIGAEMQGARMLDEVFAQYSAYMVMEQVYGKEKTRFFLEKEREKYLAGRREDENENPLIRVENQPHIYYQKGIQSMRHLREIIGETAINKALKRLLEQYRWNDPPYPTSLDAIDALRMVTPSEHQALITDLFETITLYDNETVSAQARRLEGNEYEVTVTTKSRKMRSDGKGKETEQPINDIIDVAVFAAPTENELRGKRLSMKRSRITKQDNTWIFRVQGLPYEVGIDPDAILMTRDATQNMKKIKVNP